MSLLYDAVLPGSTKLLVEGEPTGRNGRPRRKSRSRASLLASLLQWTRDPAGALGSAIGSASLAPTEPAPAPGAARKQVLQLRMKNAESYEEFKAAAADLDVLEGNNAWKLDDECDEYNAPLVATRLHQLDEARLSCDVKKMMFLLRTSLTRGLGGMGDLRLYKHSHIGTKVLIERYIESAQKTLTALMDVSAKQGADCPIEPRVLVEQLLLTRQSFGRSALLLSGGGTFGMNHIGVLKSLWQARLLPRIISGSSAGSIVCAVLCTKTDAEIPQVLEDFCDGDLAVFEREGEDEGVMKKIARFLKYGALFDISLLMGVLRTLLGDMTFQESYNRTRRILNITVSSASHYELPRLLNYVTAPNVMIWSAVCASCSVPFVFSPASLLAKDPKTGKEVPWNQTPNASWVDGSVDNDLPMTRLAEMFNVNHFIVSQVNPHVVPFLTKEEEEMSDEQSGPSWIYNMANLAKGEALHRLHVLSEMGIFPNYLTKARSILNQRYSGDITIFPAISYSQFPTILRNPTPDFMRQCLLTGERATWPKMSRIQNHLAIELALDETIRQIRARVVFSPDPIDLRRNNFSRQPSDGRDHSQHPLRRRASLKRVATHSSVPLAKSVPASPLRRKHSLVRLPFPHIARPYLPLHHRKKASVEHDPFSEAFSSSPNPGTSSDDDAMSVDTDTTYSPPKSPSGTFWNRRLFPFASQPPTPSHSASHLGYRNNSLLNLSMTMTHSAEVTAHHNNRFFPPPPGTSRSDITAVQPELQRAVRSTVESTSGDPVKLGHTQSLAEQEVTGGASANNSVPQTPELPTSSSRTRGYPWARSTAAANTKALRDRRNECSESIDDPGLDTSLGAPMDVSGT